MCSIRYLHKEFKLRYNVIDSNHKKDFPAAFIDDFFNDALFAYVEMFATGHNARRFKVGFEVTQQRIDMLSTLVVGQPYQPLLEPVTYHEVIKAYEFKLDDLKEEYFHAIRVYAQTEDCGLIKISPKQHDDLNIILNDEYRKPSKNWKRLVAAYKKPSDGSSGTSIYVYTDGQINLDGIYIEYIKCPRKIFFGGYDTIDCGNGGYCSTDDPVDPDIPDKYCTVLVDLAVQMASRSLQDVNQINLQGDKLSPLT